MAVHSIGTGKLGFRYLGNYASSTNYELQDLVSYQNSIYIYIKGTTASGIPPTGSASSSSYWHLYSQSSNSISTTAGTLIYHNGSNLAGFSSGSVGQILTSTSRQILDYTANVVFSVYELRNNDTNINAAKPRIELTDGDILTIHLNKNDATANPLILGKTDMYADRLDSSHGVDYRVNGQSFPTADAFINRLETVTVNSATIIWEVPEGFGAASNAVYYNAKATLHGNDIGVEDYTTASNPVELKWRSYENESPRKVLKLPDSVHSTTLNFAAFVMKDNSIRTIGDGSGYRHGNGSENDHEYPNLVALPNTFPGVGTLKISPHSSLVHVIDTNGELWLWGRGNVGEHGQGGAASRDFKVPIKATLPVLSPTISAVIEIADIHSANPTIASSKNNNCTMLLVRDTSNKMKLISSGYNQFGQLGHNGDVQTSNYGEVDLSNLGTNQITHVCGTGGNERTFFVLDNYDKLYSWGSNSFGTLGQGISPSMGIFDQPTVISYFVSNGISISKIRTSKNSAYAIDTNNKLYVWGGNEAGQLGLGSIVTKFDEPQYVADDVADVFTTPYDNEVVFLLMTDGTLRSSGNVANGAVGQGISVGDSILTFTDVTTSGNIPISNVSKVIIGGTGIFKSSALLKNDGSVMVCGYNGEGQLGLGDTTTRTYFEELNIREHIKDIHWFGLGQDTVLALHTENDDVYICGSGTEGLNTQLRGSNYYVPTPLIF